MIFPQDFEKRIGFDQLRERLNAYCLCPLGVDEVAKIKFNISKAQVETLLHQNQEFKSILEKSEGYPDQNFSDS